MCHKGTAPLAPPLPHGRGIGLGSEQGPAALPRALGAAPGGPPAHRAAEGPLVHTPRRARASHGASRSRGAATNAGLASNGSHAARWARAALAHHVN